LLVRQRDDYERQREAIARQHEDHMEMMRKQNELLQEEVVKTRELYSQTYREFEVKPPPACQDKSRALAMQSMMARNFKVRAERYKADFELEAKRRERKEKDLEDAEERIKTLRAEIAFLEESFGEFEVVTKRPLTKSDLDSPELHSEKRVRIEEVLDNSQAINDEHSAASIKNA
jgi:hypothetical protein